MSLRLNIFLVVSTIIVLFIIIRLIKKQTLQLKYSLLWIFIGLILIAMAIFPKILIGISYTLGIATPINALFFISIVFILIIIFSLSVALSKSSERVKTLVQEVALLNKKIEGIEKTIHKMEKADLGNK